MLITLFNAMYRVMAVPNVPTYELQALQDLYDSTNGNEWYWRPLEPQWSFAQHVNPCAPVWQGITCTLPSPGTIYYIEKILLSGYNLNGTLPLSVGNFTLLTELDVSANSFLGGSLPSSLADLVSLTRLSTALCDIYGQIPPSIGALSKLQQLELHHNFLTGTIPSSVGSLLELQSLELEYNSLSGTIPAELGNLLNLNILQLSGNAFVGPLPKELGQLTRLEDLELAQCKLTGTIPTELGNLVLLKHLKLSDNRLVGSVPSSFAALTALTGLYLSGNKLTGPLPANIVLCTNLTTLDLGNNRFSGSIPAQLGNLPLLTDINMEYNHLSGVLPASLCNLNFQSMYLPSNLLSGALPDCTWATTYNVSVAIGDNLFTGSIPDSICTLTGIAVLAVADTHLTGTLPHCVAGLINLESLNFDHCRIAGTLPSTLGLVQPALQTLYAEGNYLTGTLPPSLGNPVSLIAIKVTDNMLTGPIIRTLTHQHHLNSLQLQINFLSGTLDGVFNVTSQRDLQIVQVSSNQLTGTLPEEVFRLRELRTFDASDNCFHGALPGNLCVLRRLVTLVLDGLSSATACQKKVFPGLPDSYTLTQTVSGTVPQCLYALPSLETLHMAGNAFTGTIPENASASPALQELSLSHNVLTGTIPAALLLRPWLSLDLSYNRLSGALPSGAVAPAMFHNYSQQTLSLLNNRLSGRIPGSLQQKRNITILGTNVFSCRADGSDLPQHDNDRSTYQCGSDSFNIPYYVWLGAGVGVIACVLYLSYQKSSGVAAVQGWMRRCSSITNLPKLHSFLAVEMDILRLAALITVYAVLVLLPAYAALSHYHGTLRYGYAWAVSAAYLSGGTAVGVEITLLVVLLVLVVAVTVQCRRPNHNVSGLQSTPVSTAANVVGPHKLDVYGYMALYLIANAVVVVGANTAYVYVAIYQSSALLVLAQVLMSFFKVLWGNYGTEFLRRRLTSNAGDGKNGDNAGLLLVQVAVAVTNNIVIPCLVVACIGPSCFYDVFAAPPTVRATYNAPRCKFTINEVCILYLPHIYEVRYDPPYRYSYQCSSGLLSYYAPAYVNMCIISTFLTPAAQVLMARLLPYMSDTSALHKLLISAVPPLLKSPRAVGATETTLLHVNRQLVTLATYLALLLTFGVVFPPLAVALLLTAVVTVYFNRSALGRFLTLAEAAGSAEICGAALEQDCAATPTEDTLRTVMWMLVTLSCWFYTLFLFDTLGDAVGFKGAYWVLIVMPLVPVILYTIYRGAVFKRCVASSREANSGPCATATIKEDGIELGSVTTNAVAASAGDVATFNVLQQPNNA
jgi:Leucine-rich repeat (LRR) protein